MYNIGDTLTTAEFNKIITLLTKKPLKEQFQIKNDVTTSFGKLKFTFGTGALFTSKGILLDGNFTVKLTENDDNTVNKITLTYLLLSDYEVEDVPTVKKTVERTITLTPDTNVTVTPPTGDIVYLTYDAVYTLGLQEGIVVLPDRLELTYKKILEIDEDAVIHIKGYTDKNTPLRNEKVSIQGLTETQVTLDGNGEATITEEGSGSSEWVGASFTLQSDTSIWSYIEWVWGYSNTPYNHQDRIITTTDTQGTNLQTGENTTGYYLMDKTGTASSLNNTLQYSTGTAMDFTYHGHKGTVYIQIYDGPHTIQVTPLQLRIKKGDKCCVHCHSNNITFHLNDNITPVRTETVTLSEPFRIGFRINPNSTLKISDLVVYDAGV